MKIRILVLILFIGSISLSGQTFLYSYIDPCTNQLRTVAYDYSSPIVVSYYGQTRTFTYIELNNGSLENWLNQVYSINSNSSQPCGDILTSATAVSNTNLVTNIANTVLNLNSAVGASTSFSNIPSSKPDPSTSSGGGASNEGGTPGNVNSSNEGDPSSPSSTPGSSRGSNSSRSSGSKNEGSTQEESPPQDVEESSTETTSEEVGESSSKSKTNTQKPAILVTGDIVGLQQTEDNSQDARGTVSFTRVRGDGTASLGVSLDYMVNAQIGNVTLMQSWIGTSENGNKHINLVSAGASIQPGSWTVTPMFIRINSLKKLTAIYGVAGNYGILFREEIFSTLVIAGAMYKNRLFGNLDIAIILAGIYIPYTRYYTESWFDSSPMVIPFFNFNYKLTKTFGVGLTGGGTYQGGQDILNYQILLGAKLLI